MIQLNNHFIGMDVFNSILSFVEWKTILLSIQPTCKLFYDVTKDNQYNTWNHIWPHQTLVLSMDTFLNPMQASKFLNKTLAGTEIKLRELFFMVDQISIFDDWNPTFVQSIQYIGHECHSLSYILNQECMKNVEELDIRIHSEDRHQNQNEQFVFSNLKNLKLKYLSYGSAQYILSRCPETLEHLDYRIPLEKDLKLIEKFNSLKTYKNRGKYTQQSEAIILEKNANTLESIFILSKNMPQKLIMPQLRKLEFFFDGYTDVLDISTPFFENLDHQFPNLQELIAGTFVRGDKLHKVPSTLKSEVVVYVSNEIELKALIHSPPSAKLRVNKIRVLSKVEFCLLVELVYAFIGCSVRFSVCKNNRQLLGFNLPRDLIKIWRSDPSQELNWFFYNFIQHCQICECTGNITLKQRD